MAQYRCLQKIWRLNPLKQKGKICYCVTVLQSTATPVYHCLPKLLALLLGPVIAFNFFNIFQNQLFILLISLYFVFYSNSLRIFGNRISF